MTHPNEIQEFAQIFDLLVAGASQQNLVGKKLQEQLFGCRSTASWRASEAVIFVR